jgi:curved DNA-binding protein
MSVAFKDYYTTLGVARDATDAEIKKAFRKLARQYHPDVAADKSTAEAKFKEINEANEVLSDPAKRKKYDELGADWETGGSRQQQAPPRGGNPAGPESGGGGEFHFGGTGFSDFFEQYFSGGSRYGFPEDGQPRATAGGGGRPRYGNDIEGDILVTLEEAMQGAIRPISMQTVNRQTGKTDTTTFQVRIPAGVTDGRRIRVPGHGEPGNGGAPAGDLYLRVRHAAHPDFTTDGADLFHELDLAPWEAVLGTEVTVPSLDGPIKLRVPAAAENAQQLRVRGRGLPKGKSGDRGDFHVVLNIRIPTTLTAEERALWEQLRDLSTFRPRP